MFLDLYVYIYIDGDVGIVEIIRPESIKTINHTADQKEIIKIKKELLIYPDGDCYNEVYHFVVYAM